MMPNASGSIGRTPLYLYALAICLINNLWSSQSLLQRIQEFSYPSLQYAASIVPNNYNDTQKMVPGWNASFQMITTTRPERTALSSSSFNENSDNSNTTLFAAILSQEMEIINYTERRFDPRRICDYFQFAVSGFCKCGTTSLGSWLGDHPGIRSTRREAVAMKTDPLKTASLIRNQVTEKGPGVTGYRNPHDIQYQDVLNFNRNTCSKTKHFVLVRHPLLWFESFYNYRILNREMWSIKGKPNNLTGPICNRKPAHVCSDNGAFHRYLAKLGKTPLNTPAEIELLYPYQEEFGSPRPAQQQRRRRRMENPIFLLETSQLEDVNIARSDQLARDIQDYLQLETPMPTIPHKNSGSKLQDRKPLRAKNKTIDICNEYYKPIHSELMKVAKNASLWIRNYFLASNDVVVSSHDHFVELVEGWIVDPCLERRRAVTN